jgi:hypothetical protein
MVTTETQTLARRPQEHAVTVDMLDLGVIAQAVAATHPKRKRKEAEAPVVVPSFRYDQATNNFVEVTEEQASPVDHEPVFRGPLKDAVVRNVWTFDASTGNPQFKYDPEITARRAAEIKGVVEGTPSMPALTNVTKFTTPFYQPERSGPLKRKLLTRKKLRAAIDRDRTRNGRIPERAMTDVEFERLWTDLHPQNKRKRTGQ